MRPDDFLYRRGVSSNDYSSSLDSFSAFLGEKFFIELVVVTNSYQRDGSPFVDVTPLLNQRSFSGAEIKNQPIYGVPVFRLQSGLSAVVINPKIGDIGMVAVCDADSSAVVETRSPSVPRTRRSHSRSDSLYLGGFLNQQPTQYVEFSDDGIKIVTPGVVSVQCQSANVSAPGGVVIDAPELSVTGNISAGGNITDNSGSQSVTIKQLRDGYVSHDHAVSGVQTGSSTVNSGVPRRPI